MLLDLTIFAVMQVHAPQHRRNRIVWNALISLHRSTVPLGQGVLKPSWST